MRDVAGAVQVAAAAAPEAALAGLPRAASASGQVSLLSPSGRALASTDGWSALTSIGTSSLEAGFAGGGRSHSASMAFDEWGRLLQSPLIGGQTVPGAQVTEPLPAGPEGSTRCRNRTPAEISGGVAGFVCVPRTYYTNTPGEVKGVEIEFEARPIDGLSLNGAAGYARFDSPDLRAAGRANDRLAGIPEFNSNAGIQYEINDIVTGLIGVTLISASFHSSVRHNRAARR